MNAGSGIKEAIILQRMKFWLVRARHAFEGCPKWKARKNYLFLVRKYPALAERNGLLETDVF